MKAIVNQNAVGSVVYLETVSENVKKTAKKKTNKKSKNAKGYSAETLRKFKKECDSLIEYYMTEPLENLTVCVSDGNKKIGYSKNVSTLPVYSCRHLCGKCVKWCYDIKACLQYKNVIHARVKNFVIFKRSREKFFADIAKELSRVRVHKYFRYHVGGEIIDIDELYRLVQLAKQFPNFVMWTYTKNYNVVNLYCDIYGKDSIPGNLSIMFSEWKGKEITNPYNFPVFYCKFPDESPEKYKNIYHCPGNCDICKANGRGCLNGESSYADLH